MKSLEEDVRSLQIRRLLQLFWIVELMFGISILFSLEGQNLGEIIGKCVATITLPLVYFLIKRNKIELASSILLWILTFNFTYFVWIDAGLRDAGLVAFSGILIFAAVLGSKINFLLILFYTLSYIGFMGYASISGWHIHFIRPIDFSVIVDTILLFSAIGLSIWFLINDLTVLITKVINENIKVKNSNRIIEHMVNHDFLTNLPNRNLAKDNFEKAYENAKLHDEKIALVYLDLDNFYTINDSLGHIIGDELIRLFSDRLMEVIGGAGTLCRLGGDDFLIVLNSKLNLDIVSEKVIEIMDSMKKPFNLNSLEYVSTCSIGIAISPDNDNNFESLLRKANLALDHAKSAAKNRFVFYNTEMNVNTQEQLNLLLQLRTAIQNNEFYLCYQPKVSFCDNSLEGFEALLRWKHSKRGIVSPLSFIPIAESFGLIVEIGEWVLQEACKQCKIWHELGYDKLTIAVNVSAIQFKRGNIEEVILNALKVSGLKPEFLEIEMTESILIDDSNILIDTLFQLRKLGIKFSIDDFGTGYSNLGYLKKFQVEVLKIDQSFIRNMNNSLQDEALVKAILQMASSMGIKTVAEGVEENHTRIKLKDLNCDYGQGYYWSKPMLPPESILFIKNQR
ncbi:MAG: EAL domain-containing protein [Leptospiraceae bacterium]|nr:EAL domain-containing protein [Leptospiraceae bacterium]MBP9161836.1 EAL domain-containing protein [Leptospiraceae bacterium]